MFSAILVNVFRDERPGIHVAIKVDCQLLNQRRMHFQSRAFTTSVHELLFADDCALNTTSEGDRQRSMDLFATVCDNCGLVINTEETVAMHQLPLDTTHIAPQISVNGVQLQVVDNSTYLGSTIFCNTNIDDGVARQISKASQAFLCLQNTVWNRQGLQVSQHFRLSCL
nr:unnamed protein product [Spirometra erinaceieuropaei]